MGAAAGPEEGVGGDGAGQEERVPGKGFLLLFIINHLISLLTITGPLAARPVRGPARRPPLPVRQPQGQGRRP